MEFLSEVSFESFANVWYWLLTGTLWVLATGWTLGVPAELLANPKNAPEVARLARVNAARMGGPAGIGGPVLTALAYFALAVLLGLGLLYLVEPALALFMLAAPLLGVAAAKTALARHICTIAMGDDEIRRRLRRRHLWDQLIALGAVLVTALFGVLAVMLKAATLGS